MKKRTVWIGVLAVAAVIAALAFRGIRQEPENRIRFSGNIELTEVSIAFKTAGKLIERAVDEGAMVKKGMVLARLDRDQLLRQRDSLQAALETQQAQLTQAITTVEWARQSQERDLEQKISDLNQARARLRELEAGSRPQEVREAEANVESARSEADRSAKDWERAKVLYQRDDISTSQYDQYRQRAESAAAALRQAEQRLALVREGPRKEEIDAARAQVARAEAAIRWSEAQRLDVQRRREDVPARRAEIERARAQIALVDSQLADTIALSPIDGVVLVKSADPGEVLAPGTAVLTVGDIDHPWLRGYIGERDLGRVKPGAKVKVTTDSYPGKIYWGRVSFISSEAEFTPKQIQTQEERIKLVYRIKVDVDNPQHELKSNMPADAEIVFE